MDSESDRLMAYTEAKHRLSQWLDLVWQVLGFSVFSKTLAPEQRRVVEAVLALAQKQEEEIDKAFGRLSSC